MHGATVQLGSTDQTNGELLCVTVQMDIDERNSYRSLLKSWFMSAFLKPIVLFFDYLNASTPRAKDQQEILGRDGLRTVVSGPENDSDIIY